MLVTVNVGDRFHTLNIVTNLIMSPKSFNCHHNNVTNKHLKPPQSQKHFYFHSVTRTQLEIESSDSMLSSEENEKVDIDELQDFYLFWSMICLILISLVLMAFTWVKINRKRPTPANIDLNFTKPYWN